MVWLSCQILQVRAFQIVFRKTDAVRSALPRAAWLRLGLRADALVLEKLPKRPSFELVATALARQARLGSLTLRQWVGGRVLLSCLGGLWLKFAGEQSCMKSRCPLECWKYLEVQGCELIRSCQVTPSPRSLFS